MTCQGYTYYELAKATRLSQTSTANWYNSVNNEPSVKALEKACEVFGITRAELFSGDDDVLLPCKEDFRALFDKWQRITPTWCKTIIVVAYSYLNNKDSVKLNCLRSSSEKLKCIPMSIYCCSCCKKLGTEIVEPKITIGHHNNKKIFAYMHHKI